MRECNDPFILAVSPSARSFCFVVFQGAERPLDWGTKRFDGAGKNFRIIKVLANLIALYHPTVIVIESTTKTRRRDRNQVLLQTIARLAEKKGITIVRYTQAQVHSTFVSDGAMTRPEIAKAIAARIPAFGPLIP